MGSSSFSWYSFLDYFTASSTSAARNQKRTQATLLTMQYQNHHLSTMLHIARLRVKRVANALLAAALPFRFFNKNVGGAYDLSIKELTRSSITTNVLRLVSLLDGHLLARDVAPNVVSLQTSTLRVCSLPCKTLATTISRYPTHSTTI